MLRHRPICGEGLRRLALLVVLVAAACAADEPVPPRLDGEAPVPQVAAGPSPGCDAGRPAPDGQAEEELDVDGASRSYRLAGPGGPGPAPLLLGFHGLGSAADQHADYTGIEDLTGRGAAVVVPEGTGLIARWALPGSDGAEADLALVVGLLDDLGRRFCVDLDRVVVSGLSNGAAFSSMVACELDDVVAGALLVGGANLVQPCDEGRPLPVAIVHGTDDDIVPFDGGDVLFGLAEADPVERTAAGWARRNGCDPAPEEDRIGDEVRRLRWTDCVARTELYVVEGGGHTWPGARQVTGLGHVTDQLDITALLGDLLDIDGA